MSADTGSAADRAEEATPPLARLFVLIVFVECLSVAGLYWFGVHFGS